MFEALLLAAFAFVAQAPGSVPLEAVAEQSSVLDPWSDLDHSFRCLPWEEATRVFDLLDLDFSFAGSATITRDSDARVVLRIANHGKEAIVFADRGILFVSDVWLELECEGPAWGQSGWYPDSNLQYPAGLEVVPFALSWDLLEQIPHTTLDGGRAYVEEFPLNSIEVFGESGICRVTLGTRLQFLVENSELTPRQPACMHVEAARTLRIDMREEIPQ